MMNMMTGAVVINGGVGVMEIRQPKMAASEMQSVTQEVGEVTENLMLNAHITLRELKNQIDTVVLQKLPGFKQLMAMNPVVVARTAIKNAILTAYDNGYAVYEADGAHTVMAVSFCGDYRYNFTDGTYNVVPAEAFEEEEWSVRLLMEGERRLENNRSKISHDYEDFMLSNDGSDWCDAAMMDFMEKENAEMLADKELRRLYAAMSKLTEHQSEIIQLYYYKGMTQEEIGAELGLKKCTICREITGALKKIKKNF